MNKYTASQVREAIESFSACDIGGELMAIAEDYIDLLRERESAKSAVTDEMVEQAVDARIEIISRKGHVNVSDNAAMRAALEAVVPMLASARVPDGFSETVAECVRDIRKHAKQVHDLPLLQQDLRRLANRIERKLAAAPKPEKE